MKPSKSAQSPKGKHKLSSDFENQKVSPIIGKRTRANTSVVDEFQKVKRSSRIRSRNLEAFGELANNYNFKKSTHDLDEPVVAKRAKRSSTCSSSSSVQSIDVEDPPLTPTIRKGRSASVKKKDQVNGTKRNSISNGNSIKSENGTNSRNQENPTHSDNKTEAKNLNESLNNSPVNGSIQKFEKAVTRSSNKSVVTSPIKVSSENKTNSPKTNGKVELFPTLKSENKSDPEDDITLAMLCTKKLENSKKNIAEDNGLILTKNRRTRRLSQKGEMASVIEFVFNQKKNENLVPLSTPILNQTNLKNTPQKSDTNSSKSKNTSQNPDEATTAQDAESSDSSSKNITEALPYLNDNIPIIPILDCKINDRTTKISNKQIALSTNLPQNCISEIPPQTATQEDDKELKTNSSPNNLSLPEPDIKTNTVPNIHANNIETKSEKDKNDELNEKSDADSPEPKDKDEFLKWRKRSLRSSGVKCQPDFYALSLDLMIHRNRKRNSETVDTDDELNNSNNSGLPPASPNANLSPSSPVNNKATPDKNYLSDNNKTDALSSETKSHIVEQETNLPTDQANNQNLFSSTPKSTPIKLTPTKCTPTRGRGRGRGKWRGGRGRGGFHRTLKAVPTQDPFEPPPLFKEEPPTGPGVYYFESDHVALKHNQDYHCVLKSYAKLEAQRRQALLDLDKLQARLQDGLDNPISFVDNLQQKVNLNLPSSQQIFPLPEVNWSKYISQFGTFDHVFSNNLPPSATKPFTRRKKNDFESDGTSSSQIEAVLEQESSSSSNMSKSRSQTFKKNWSVEEQRKLEELLLKYPQESVEFNRFRKIAAELKDRTALQVQSRIQKYFIKLAKAGLPIPGRMPRLERIVSAKPKRFHRHRTHPQSSLTRISTFFSDFHVPVKMGDDDEEDAWGAGRANEEEDGGGWDNVESEQVSDEEDIPNELRFSDEYLEILRLKRKRKKKLCVLDNKGKQALAEHFGYQCDICKDEPIRGVRFHCIDCPHTDSVDLCQSCIRTQSQFETSVHKSNHRMEPVYASLPQTSNTLDSDNNTDFPDLPGPYTDNDYTKVASLNPTTCGYNYLDPNYLPPKG